MYIKYFHNKKENSCVSFSISKTVNFPFQLMIFLELTKFNLFFLEMINI